MYLSVFNLLQTDETRIEYPNQYQVLEAAENVATFQAENLPKNQCRPVALIPFDTRRPWQCFESQRCLSFLRHILPLHEMAAQFLTHRWSNREYRVLVVGRLRVG